MSETIFPDITPFLEAKARGRAEIASLSFGEKIEMMEALRERLLPFKEARQARKAIVQKPAGS